MRNVDIQEGVGEVQHWETFGNSFNKGIKLEFPRFGSKNPAAWIYRAKQYFSYIKFLLGNESS